MAGRGALQPALQGHPLSTDIDRTAVERGCGHVFARVELLAEALTHRSALDRAPALKAAFPHGNERLEFLGDRVLSLAIATLLLRRHPAEREGELARRHAALVREETLAAIAGAIDLGRHVRIADSERGGRPVRDSILADAIEALVGAIHLDAGYAAAAATVERLWGDRIDGQTEAPRDSKTALQEWAQARRLKLPAYREVGREGPPHAPTFVVEVSVEGAPPHVGRAGSKREAERLAAMALLVELEGR